MAKLYNKRDKTTMKKRFVCILKSCIAVFAMMFLVICSASCGVVYLKGEGVYTLVDDHYAVTGINWKTATYLEVSATYEDLPVTVIGEGAFWSHYFLEQVKLPESIITIEKNAFRDCRVLSRITISEGVQTIGENAFALCCELTGITLPDSVREVGKEVFRECTKLTTVNIPANLTYISESMFKDCISLTKIEIPSHVTVIGGFAFLDCKGLTKLTVPDSVITIGDMAFAYCNNLKEIVIGERVNDIGKWAFDGCDLQSVTFNNPVGWSVSLNGSQEEIRISETDLKDKNKAAKLMKDYTDYDWHRSDN